MMVKPVSICTVADRGIIYTITPRTIERRRSLDSIRNGTKIIAVGVGSGGHAKPMMGIRRLFGVEELNPNP